MKKILMLVLDGFSMREESFGNAVKNAGMSNFINIWNEYPHSLIKASGPDIGLPQNQCSNSYLGYKIIGAGRKVPNRLTETLNFFKEKKYKSNESYLQLIENLKSKEENSLHLFTMLSDGGVLSHIDYLIEFLQVITSELKDNKIYIHIIADGEDASRFSFFQYYNKISRFLNEQVKIATLCGRNYILEPKKLNGINNYYDLLFNEKGLVTPSVEKIVNLCYQKKITDRYIPPTKTSDFDKIKKGDALFFLNFENESQRLLIDTISARAIKENEIYTLYELSKKSPIKDFLKNDVVENTLNKYLSNIGLEQVRIFESCKTACLYYLDGGQNVKIANCTDLIVKTPKVETFSEKPELNALTVTKTAIRSMEQDYDFIMANFANADLVGHTGNFEATIQALQVMDLCLKKLVEYANDNFYKVILIGTHGNVDTLINENKEVITKNTLSPVPFVILDKKIKLKNGPLQSVTPTILEYMDIAKPKEMKDTETLIEEL